MRVELHAALVTIAIFGTSLDATARTKGETVSASVEFRAPGSGIDGDRIDEDGRGAYVDGVEKVSVKIDSDAHNNDVVMDLSRTRGTRRLFLDLTDCADAACDQRPFDTELVVENVRMQTRAARLFDFPIGATRPVRLWVHFRWNEQAWWIRLDSEDRETDCQSHNATAARRGQKEWVITAGQEQVACLLTIVDGGKEARGRFRMPHQFVVRLK